MFPDFSKLDALGKELTDFMQEVKNRLAEIETTQQTILDKMEELKK